MTTIIIAIPITSKNYTPPTSTIGTKYYYVVVTNTNNSVNRTKTATQTSTTAAAIVNANARTPIVVSGVKPSNAMDIMVLMINIMALLILCLIFTRRKVSPWRIL